MRLALDQAHNALLVGEVPVGAVILRDTRRRWHSRSIATGYNRPDHHARPDGPRRDRGPAPRRHAARELPAARLRAVRDARALRDVRDGADARPLQARGVRRARSEDRCAAGSVLNLFAHPQLNHHTELVGGVMAEPCGDPAAQLLRRTPAAAEGRTAGAGREHRHNPGRRGHRARTTRCTGTLTPTMTSLSIFSPAGVVPTGGGAAPGLQAAAWAGLRRPPGRQRAGAPPALRG